MDTSTIMSYPHRCRNLSIAMYTIWAREEMMLSPSLWISSLWMPSMRPLSISIPIPGVYVNSVRRWLKMSTSTLINDSSNIHWSAICLYPTFTMWISTDLGPQLHYSLHTPVPLDLSPWPSHNLNCDLNKNRYIDGVYRKWRQHLRKWQRHLLNVIILP